MGRDISQQSSRYHSPVWYFLVWGYLEKIKRDVLREKWGMVVRKKTHVGSPKVDLNAYMESG